MLPEIINATAATPLRRFSVSGDREALQEAYRIYSRYVKSGAPDELNISASTRVLYKSVFERGRTKEERMGRTPERGSRVEQQPKRVKPKLPQHDDARRWREAARQHQWQPGALSTKSHSACSSDSNLNKPTTLGQNIRSFASTSIEKFNPSGIQIDGDVFLRVETEIYRLMETDSWGRFQRTGIFKRLFNDWKIELEERMLTGTTMKMSTTGDTVTASGDAVIKRTLIDMP